MAKTKIQWARLKALPSERPLPNGKNYIVENADGSLSQYSVTSDGVPKFIRGISDDESSRISRLTGSEISKLEGLDTQAELDVKFNNVSLGTQADSITTAMTAPQLNALPDGLYLAQTSGTFANGMIAKENYRTIFKKVGLTWSLQSEVKVDAPVGTPTIIEDGSRLTQEKAVATYVNGDFKNSITGERNFNIGKLYTDYPMGTIDGNGNITGTTTDTRRWSGYIYIKGVSKLVFKNFIGAKYVAFYNENKVSLGARIDILAGVNEVTVPPNAYYVGIVIRIDNTYVQDYANLFYGFTNNLGFANQKVVEDISKDMVSKGSIGELSYTTNILPNADKKEDYPMGTISTANGQIVQTTNPDRRYSGLIDVSKYTKVTPQNFPVGQVVHYCFYDSSQLPIFSSLGTITNGVDIVKPANAKYFACNIYVSGGILVNLNYSQIFIGNINNEGFLVESNIEPIDERISDLERLYKFSDEALKIRVDVTKDFPTGTQRERIQQALDFVAGDVGGIVYLNSDNGNNVWLIDASLEIGDNTTLIIGNGIKLKMADGVFDTIIRNKGIIPNYYGSGVPNYRGLPNDDKAPYYPAIEVNPNKNIKILGYGKNNSFIEGADIAKNDLRPYSSSTTPQDWVGDNYGWRTITLCFANVQGLEVSDIGISKTKGWGLVVDYFTENFKFENLKIHSTVANGDGIDVLQFCQDGVIKNNEFNTLDDAVFIGSISRNDTPYPTSTYIFPMYVAQNKLLEMWDGKPISEQVGGYTRRITVDNIYGCSSTLMTRILSTWKGKVHDISLSNINHSDSARRPDRVVGVETGYAYTSNHDSSTGDVYNININNVQTVSSLTTLRVIKIPVINSWFNKIGKSTAGTAIQFVNTIQQPSLKLTNIA